MIKDEKWQRMALPISVTSLLLVIAKEFHLYTIVTELLQFDEGRISVGRQTKKLSGE